MRPSAFYLFVGGASLPFVRGLFRLRQRGLENLPASGGFVLASNHVSNFDPWAIGVPLFPGRFLRFMAKSELYWFPLGQLISAGGAFPVRRGERDLEAMQTAVDLARAGHVVAMFPEGTRRRKGLRKKWEAKAHTGAARIALDAGVPLVPAAIRGTDSLRRLGPIRVAYGKPLEIEGLTPEVATGRLMEEIARLEASL